MVGLGPEVREARHWDEAVEVGHLTMAAVRRNVERLVDLLTQHGYVFLAPEGMEPFVPASGDTTELDRLEQLAGPLPLALRCWFEDVGEVNFIGGHPDWRFDYPDPLVLDSTPEFLVSEYRQWEDDRGTRWDAGAFTADLAPDYLHKADVSGGAPYSMTVPNGAADGLLLWERHQTTLVNYLRITFRWAGFPGWERGLLDGWAAPPEPAPAMLGEIAAHLEPI
jgi:hypothetical protein